MHLFTTFYEQRAVYERVNAISARLSKKPESVEQFVSLLAFLDEELAAQKDLQDAFNDLQRFVYLVKYILRINEILLAK